MDHSSHLAAMETISDYDNGLKLLQKTLKQPRCANHPTETQGFYCFDEKSFVCLQCRCRCDSSGHTTEFFDFILNQRIEEFKEVCLRIEEKSSSENGGLDKFQEINTKVINQLFDELIERIERKRAETLKEYQESFDKATQEKRIVTPALREEWEGYKKKLEAVNYSDFISETSEGTTFKTFWQEKMVVIPSTQLPETFLPTVKKPSQEWFKLPFLDHLVSHPSTTTMLSTSSFMVQKNSRTLLQRSPNDQKESPKPPQSWPIPDHLLSAKLLFDIAPSITNHTNTTTAITTVYISGGGYSDNTQSNQLVSFDTSNHQWQQVCELPHHNGVYGHSFTCSPDGNTLYVVGGVNKRSGFKQCWSYNLVTTTTGGGGGGEESKDGGWSRLADLPYCMAWGSCFCHSWSGDGDGDGDGRNYGYCLVFCSTWCERSSDEGGLFVLNFQRPGGSGEGFNGFDVGAWTRVKVRLRQDGGGLQSFRWRNDRAVILSSSGKAWKLKLGKEFKLERLELNKTFFVSQAGFCLDGNVLGVLGDMDHWNEIKTDDLI